MASSTPPDPWLPEPQSGVQVNFCRNPDCPRFGVLPVPRVLGRGAGKSPDGYRRVGVGDKLIGLRCDECGETSTVMSNAGIAEEVARYGATPGGQPGCKTAGCTNAGVSPASRPDAYQAFGTTSAGSPRFRCRACASTFSVSVVGTHRLRQPEKTEAILKLLVNKMPMRRICEVADTSPKVLYDRITRMRNSAEPFRSILNRYSSTTASYPGFT